jgi:hypothetical protein
MPAPEKQPNTDRTTSQADFGKNSKWVLAFMTGSGQTINHQETL